MGCCLSTATKRDSHQPSNHHSPPKPPLSNPYKITKTQPPSASLEEETVKEVLSETTISKPPPPPLQTTVLPTQQHKGVRIPILEEPKAKPQNVITNQHKRGEAKRTPEISQASEICSITDTISTATTTTTVTEIREDEAISKKRVNRSPVKAPRKRLHTTERDRVVKSPAKRERQPPVRRELPGQVRTTHRNTTSVVKRDAGERSGRRSRSPATRGASDGVGRGRAGGSPAKMTGRASGRSGEAGVGTGVKAKQEKENGSVLSQQQEQQKKDEQGGNESLENPLVSLECFIFL